jgi:hypothetical protein
MKKRMDKQISISRKAGGRYILIPPKDIEDEVLEQASEKINEWVKGENPVLVLTSDWQCVSITVDKKVRGVISVILLEKDNDELHIKTLPFVCQPNEFSDRLNQLQNDLVRAVDMEKFSILPGTLTVQTI